MIPQLYDSFSPIGPGTGYNTHYIGNLTSCTKCEVREVRNDAYTLDLETTINDECADEILSQRMILAKPNPADAPQYFEIQKTTRTANGIIKVEAKHIKNFCFQICSEGDYSAEGEIQYYNGTPAEVWARMTSLYITTQVPFSFTSDITNKVNYYLGITEPETLGNMLGGKEGSFVDMWGGEYHWNNFSISFLNSRGRNTGFCLRYGSNISDASQSESCVSTYSHILPYGKVSKGNIKINFFAPMIEIPNNECEYTKVYMCDCTDFLEGYEVGEAGAHYEEVKAAMTAYATSYANVNNLGKAKISISVNVRATLDEMSDLGLCDTVSVILDNFGTQSTAKITEVVYDVLLERWIKIVIGSPRITVADIILNKRRVY